MPPFMGDNPTQCALLMGQEPGKYYIYHYVEVREYRQLNMYTTPLGCVPLSQELVYW